MHPYTPDYYRRSPPRGPYSPYHSRPLSPQGPPRTYFGDPIPAPRPYYSPIPGPDRQRGSPQHYGSYPSTPPYYPRYQRYDPRFDDSRYYRTPYPSNITTSSSPKTTRKKLKKSKKKSIKNRLSNINDTKSTSTPQESPFYKRGNKLWTPKNTQKSSLLTSKNENSKSENNDELKDEESSTSQTKSQRATLGSVLGNFTPEDIEKKVKNTRNNKDTTIITKIKNENEDEKDSSSENSNSKEEAKGVYVANANSATYFGTPDTKKKT